MGAAQLLFHQMNDVGLKKSLNCYLVHFPICHKKQSSDLRANHEMQYKWLVEAVMRLHRGVSQSLLSKKIFELF